MKRLHFYLLALLILLSAGQLWAQEQVLPYKSRAMFKEDTLQYLTYNYKYNNHGQHYIGKTAGEFLDELEYPVLYVAWVGRSGKMVMLYFGIRQVAEKPHELLDDYIIVGFENPPNSREFQAVYDRESRALTPELFNFIKDLKISGVDLYALPREDVKRILKM